MWAAFFASPVPPGGTNWNAYTHEQLYQMLWEDADVGDVSTVAAEWGRHGDALTESADALRSQGPTLRSNWQGQAADLAADRLAELSATGSGTPAPGRARCRRRPATPAMRWRSRGTPCHRRRRTR